MHPNTVGTEYMLMERVKGYQLSEVWDTMSEAQRFGLVKNLVEIETKLAKMEFTKHGSLYYKGTYPRGGNIDPGELPSSKQGATAKFVIGPTTERSFWENEKRELDIDRGPCKCI